LQGILSYRYGTITREVIRGPKIEFCSTVKLGSKIPLVHEFLKFTNTSVPGIVHECPYHVSFNDQLKVLLNNFKIFRG
jgi:hypothetical protein